MSFDPRFRAPTTRAKIVTAAYVPFIAGSAYLMWMLVSLIGMMEDARRGEDVSFDELMALAHRVDNTSLGSLVLCVIGMIAYLVWVHRVAANVAARGYVVDSPALSVGSYFIPIVSLWKPYGAMRNIWLCSDPSLPAVDGMAPPPAGRAPFWLPLWWAAWIITVILNRIALMGSEPKTPEEGVASLRFMFVASGVNLVSLSLLLVVVWSVTKRQERCTPVGLAHAVVR